MPNSPEGGTWDAQDADNSPETSLGTVIETNDLRTQRVNVTLEKGADTRKLVHTSL